MANTTGLGDTIYTAVKNALGNGEGYDNLKKPYGLGDTIYVAVKKAINDAGGSGGGGSSTQTLTVTKGNESDTVSVATIGWADFIAQNHDALVEVQPDSTEGLVSVYSILVGTAFRVRISGANVGLYLDAEMRVNFNTVAMPSTPLYARPEY